MPEPAVAISEPVLASLLSRWDTGGRASGLLDSLCADHPSLASELRSRAGALARADDAFARLAPNPARAPDVPGYDIVRWLGEGGMGTVWEAVQRSTRRRVAIKLLPPHRLSTPKALARFEREIELAARLDHPHIARVYEPGRTAPPEHTAYFSMQLISGLPADLHFATHFAAGAPIDAVLQTVLLAADALAFAHARGVLHRDLKPTNLLIAPPAEGSSVHTPFLLDFGLAREIDAGESDPALTLDAPFAGTPGYCAPEQARGESATTRSDLFSLALIAFRLLTTRHAYDITLPPQRLLHHIATTPPDLASLLSLPPDLRAVLAKALAFDPAGRYATVDAFARDLRAFLDHRPVSARPPGSLGHMRSLYRRHRRAVLIASFAVLTFATVSAYYVLNLRSERAASQRSAMVAAQANQLLADILSAADPATSRGRDLRVRDVLDEAVRRLDESAANKTIDPMVEAQVRLVIGKTYYALDARPAAAPQIRRALELAQSLYGPDDRRTLPARTVSAQFLSNEPGNLDVAIEMHKELHRLTARHFGGADPETITALINVAALYGNNARYDDLDAFVRAHAKEIDACAALPAGSKIRWSTLLIDYHVRQNNFDEAFRISTWIVEQQTSSHGLNHPATARAIMNHGTLYCLAGKPALGLPLLQQALDLRIKVLGPAHADTANAALLLTDCHTQLGHLDLALQTASEALRTADPTCTYNPHLRNRIAEIEKKMLNPASPKP